MLIEVAGIDYNFKRWDQLTLKEADQIEKLKVPERLYNYYKDTYEGKNPEWIYDIEEVIEIFPEYYGKVLEIMTDIPKDILSKINAIDRTDFFDEYCRPMVLDLIGREPQTYQTKGITSFIFKDIEYLFPENLKILEMNLPADSACALEFTESSAIITAWAKSEKGWDSWGLVTAIYCRPKGEKYDKKIVTQRAIEFQDLTMDVILELFFYIVRSLNLYQNDIRYMKQKEIENLQASMKTLSGSQDLVIMGKRRGYTKSRTKRISKIGK
jgi:hypothetical protein